MGYLAAKQRKFLELVRSAKCLLAAVAHVKEAVLVLVRVINTSHQASCGKKFIITINSAQPISTYAKCLVSTFCILKFYILIPFTTTILP